MASVRITAQRKVDLERGGKPGTLDRAYFQKIGNSDRAANMGQQQSAEIEVSIRKGLLRVSAEEREAGKTLRRADQENCMISTMPLGRSTSRT